jgi:hypothetical protein
VRIEVEILRIAEGGEHSAEVGGYILQNKGVRHVFFALARPQNEVTEGKEGQECHIVRDKHRAYEGYIHEREDAEARVFRFLDYLLGQNVEEADIFERANYGKHAKETGEGLEVKIAEIFGIDAHDNARHDSRKKGNRHYDVSSEKFDYGAQMVGKMTVVRRPMRVLEYSLVSHSRDTSLSL